MLGSNVTKTGAEIWQMASATPGDSASLSVVKVNNRVNAANGHPGLALAAQLPSDPFWIDILSKMARGNCPRGFALTNRQLIHRTSGQRLDLPDTPVELLAAVLDFLRVKGNVYSSIDMEYLDRQAAQARQDQYDPVLIWNKTYKSREARAQLIQTYVESLSLSPSLQRELYVQIHIGLDLGYLKQTDFHVINHDTLTIVGITGVGLDGDRVVLTSTKSSRKVTAKASHTGPERDHMMYWYKSFSALQAHVALVRH